jgi:glycosyltransferase involved in cell wall biosynthesis
MSKTMQPSVLHLIDSFEQGGTERQAVQLVRLLHASGRYRVHMACLSNRGPLLDDVLSLGLAEIPEYPLQNFYNRNAVTQLRRFSRLLREREIKVVHTHGLYTNIFGMTAARLARVPARIASRRETNGLRSAVKRRVERYAFRLSQAVVANAEAVREQLIEEGVRNEKIVTVYNGLDMRRVLPPTDLRRDEALAMFNLPSQPERSFITIVANVRHPVKDHPMFLRAASRVHAAFPEAAFVIAGEGGLMESLRALAAELGIERDTFFIGRCTNVAALLSISDVCVLSSKAEGFSNSILEYMAAACPVVATDVGGAREAVIEGETGYLVPAGDDELMAARIVSLLREPERARAMGERGRRLVAEKFSCETQLERTENLYDRLLAHAAPSWVHRVKSLPRESL